MTTELRARGRNKNERARTQGGQRKNGNWKPKITIQSFSVKKEFDNKLLLNSIKNVKHFFI